MQKFRREVLFPSSELKSKLSKQEAQFSLLYLKSDIEDGNNKFFRNVGMLLVPEDKNLHTPSRENLKFEIMKPFFGIFVAYRM
jgi:hypothetical protein